MRFIGKSDEYMSRLYLGEFEEIVLLIVAILYQEAYAVAIKSEITAQSGRKVNISAVHKSLYRLEEKGMLTPSCLTG